MNSEVSHTESKNMSLESVVDALHTRLEQGGYSIAGSRLRERDVDIKIRLSSTFIPVDQRWLEQLKFMEYSLPISCITATEDAVNVNLDRSETFVRILKNSSRGINQSVDPKVLSVDYDVNNSKEDLTNYRVLLFAQTIENLAAVAGENLQRYSAAGRKYHMSNKSNHSSPLNSDKQFVLCGSVLNSERNKKETLTVSDVKRLKKEMLLKEMEEKDNMNENVALQLADAILKYDLLSVKVPKPVLLDVTRSESGASGSVVFVMYNYSRLNAILHEYQSRVNRNYYPASPLIEEIDFSALKKEDEWKLLRDYVMYFPVMLQKTVEGLENGKPAPQLLCQFLYALARAVSSYYRSTKILLDGKSSLLNVTFARIQLVKAIHQILRQGLELLNIEALPAM